MNAGSTGKGRSGLKALPDFFEAGQTLYKNQRRAGAFVFTGPAPGRPVSGGNFAQFKKEILVG